MEFVGLQEPIGTADEFDDDEEGDLMDFGMI